MRQCGKPARYIELLDEINNHVFQWATDTDWNTLPPKVNVALTTLMNELKIAKAMKDAGETDTNDSTIASEQKRFIVLFKKKYTESCDMVFSDPITAINKVNIARVITNLKNEGGRYDEFIEWFFDDYCSLEENKKFMPPQINYMCSYYVVNKFIYIMKDKFRMRKDDISREETRTVLLEIAIPLMKRIKSREFQGKMMDFNDKKISATKFFSIMEAFAKKYGDTEAIEACARISDKAEELKKAGI